MMTITNKMNIGNEAIREKTKQEIETKRNDK
jgi:hypothetical protein